MHKQLGLSRKVVVNDIVQEGHVEASCSQICHKKDLSLFRSKLGCVDLPGCGIKVRIDKGGVESSLCQQQMKIFHVMSGCTEDYQLLIIRNHLRIFQN